MTFEEYLISKKIDSAAFNNAEPLQWKEWKGLFDQMHPSSFTSRKLYLINGMRRKYQLKTANPPATSAPEAPLKSKPIIRPKIN